MAAWGLGPHASKSLLLIPRLSKRQRLAELILTLKTRLARPSPQPFMAEKEPHAPPGIFTTHRQRSRRHLLEVLLSDCPTLFDEEPLVEKRRGGLQANGRHR